MKTKIQNLKLSAFIEGWSFLILLLIAMPLKYWMGFPIATKIVGSIHGILFIWFIFALLVASYEQKWNIKFIAIAFISSLIPFGTFFLNKELVKKEEVIAQNA
jgi:integral membrane protein